MKAEITYLYHSAFSVDTGGQFLIFDYYLDEPHGCGLSKGVVNPEEIRDRNVTVFASHSHPDHFSRKIFSWRKTVNNIRYVLASEIHSAGANMLAAHPGKSYDLGDMTVHALRSTDLGVAFLVKTEGLCLYHAGDLNWWKWDENTNAENEKMGLRYRREIDGLKGEKIDVAFIPVDPRQGEDSLLGLTYFMDTVGAEHVVPMHSFGRMEFFERLKTDPRTASFREKILFYSSRGETLTI